MNPPALLVRLLFMIAARPDRAEAQAFSWATGEFGMCSDECAGGTHARSVDCQDDLGVCLADSFSQAIGPKPTSTQACNTQSRVYNGSTGSFISFKNADVPR